MEVLIAQENRQVNELTLACVESLVPVDSVVPVDSLQPVMDIALNDSLDRRQGLQCYNLWYVIPFKTFAIRVDYTFMLRKCTLEIIVECTILNMVQKPQSIANEYVAGELKWQPTPRLCAFSFNWIFCPRCATGICCESHEIPAKMSNKVVI